MKFSTKAHYGLRLMVGLAQGYDGGPIALAAIARAEGISLGYLEQLAARLRKAGLVEGTRGVRGGYRLTTPPSQITVGHVLRALEGPIVPVGCVSEDIKSGYCDRERDCRSRRVWQQIYDTLTQVLDSTTLANLCQQHTG